MVSTSELTEAQASAMFHPASLDPSVVAAAKEIYNSYFKARSQTAQRPVGVAVARQSYRGQLVFTGRPILLPHECFVSVGQLESVAQAEAVSAD